MKTISIFLPTGNPNGIKIVELSNRLIKAIFVPRALLNEAKDRKELYQPALYVLCEKQGNTVYVGELLRTCTTKSCRNTIRKK